MTDEGVYAERTKRPLEGVSGQRLLYRGTL